MEKKKSDFKSGAKFRVFAGILVFLLCLLALDAFRSQGIFHYFSRKCSCAAKGAFGNSVVAVQRNFHVVAPGVWRSAQPNSESLRKMKSYGLKTLVNLRLDGEAEPWENKLAGELGIRYYSFPFSGAQVVPAKTVDDVLSILSDPKQQPVLIHCGAGKDRTGMLIAAYRITKAGWPFRDIYQEMRMYGYDEIQFPEMLRTLRLWSGAQGRFDVAQEIALIEKKLTER